MKRDAIVSSVIAEAAYDPNSAILEIAFHDRRVYQYLLVPLRVYHEFVAASSHGQYFNRNIKDHYAYVQIQ